MEKTKPVIAENGYEYLRVDEATIIAHKNTDNFRVRFFIDENKNTICKKLTEFFPNKNLSADSRDYLAVTRRYDEGKLAETFYCAGPYVDTITQADFWLRKNAGKIGNFLNNLFAPNDAIKGLPDPLIGRPDHVPYIR